MNQDPDLQEQIAKAEERFAENPEGRVFAQLADLYRKAGEYEQAQAIVEQGLEHHPDYLTAHIVRGRTHLDQGDADRAAEAFSRALELDSENLVALRHMADLARERGDMEEARRWYGRILRVDPLNEEVKEIMSKITGEDVEQIDDKARRAAGSADETVAYWEPDADQAEELQQLGQAEEEEEEEPAPEPEASREEAASEPEAAQEEAAPTPEEEPAEPPSGGGKETIRGAQDAVDQLRQMYPDEEDEAPEDVPAEEETPAETPTADLEASEDEEWPDLDWEEAPDEPGETEEAVAGTEAAAETPAGEDVEEVAGEEEEPEGEDAFAELEGLELDEEEEEEEEALADPASELEGLELEEEEEAEEPEEEAAFVGLEEEEFTPGAGEDETDEEAVEEPPVEEPPAPASIRDHLRALLEGEAEVGETWGAR